NAATVGGNICMSLPAGPMISLTVALEGTYTLWPRNAPLRDVPAVDFVTGNHTNVLRPGELLRSIRLPAAALSKRYAFRHASLTHVGRSAALLIGHAKRRGRRPPDHDHRGDATANSASLQESAVRNSIAAHAR